MHRPPALRQRLAPGRIPLRQRAAPHQLGQCARCAPTPPPAADPLPTRCQPAATTPHRPQVDYPNLGANNTITIEADTGSVATLNDLGPGLFQKRIAAKNVTIKFAGGPRPGFSNFTFGWQVRWGAWECAGWGVLGWVCWSVLAGVCWVGCAGA
jgi:hypothetical protein